MIRFIIFSFLCIQQLSLYSQASIFKPLSRNSSKSITDFGAKPNDGKDDTWAFIKAGKYFSNLWDINGVPLKKGQVNFNYRTNAAKLIIPSGTYQVGTQVNIPAAGLTTSYGKIFGYAPANAPLQFSANAAHKAGLEIMTIFNTEGNIDGLTILGTGKTKPIIKYNDGLHIGYFNNKAVPQFMTDDNYNGAYAVTIGNFISVISAKNIFIQNIEIDGNNIPKESKGKTIYDGGFGNNLIQMGGTGIYLLNSKNITLQNLNIHHMTLDGVIYHDYYRDTVKYKNQAPSNLSIDNIVCNYNRRQGFSWVGGKNIKVTNSKFNNTSVVTTGKASGNPGAGLDIEPEEDDKGEPLFCIDGKFINCEFVNNLGCALVNDLTGFRTLNMVFDNCKFQDVDTYAVWVKGRQFTFNNCKIWGGFVHGNDGKNPEDATVFNNCDFADEEIKERPGKYNIGYALVDIWQVAKHTRFNNCTFRTLHPKQRLVAVYTPSANESEFTVFSNCSFIAGSQSSGEDVMYGCVFDKNTRFISYNKNEPQVINMNGIVVKGNTSSAIPYSFNVQGKILLSVANGNGMQLTQFVIGRGVNKNTDGYIDFNVGSGSCLYGSWNQAIDIGKNAKFVNKAGGQIAFLSAQFNNSGKIVLENESNTAFFNPVFVKTATTGLPAFIYNKHANMKVAPEWAGRFTGLGTPLKMSRIVIDKHTKIVGDNVDKPVFKNNQ